MTTYIAFDLETLYENGFFSDLDYYSAKTIADVFNEKDGIVLASCALVSKQLAEGHICIDIVQASGSSQPVSEKLHQTVRFPDENVWLTALKNTPVVSATVDSPMVLDSENRLYFSRYFDFQSRLANNIAQRVSLKKPGTDEMRIDQILTSFFKKEDPHTHAQKMAVKSAVINPVTIISGGPGTGKTYVTTMIKKVLFAYAKEQQIDLPRIICTAPTGKAASKMDQGSTIHAILKPLKDRPGFYFNKRKPLHADVVIIDEASMIDLPLLTRLFEAVQLSARIIILGDKHQLSSIQAGAVFYDICNVKALSDFSFVLEHNFRSKGKTGIENLSRAINENNADLVGDILTSKKYADIVFEEDLSNLKKYILKGYQPFITAATTEDSLDELDTFKVLCAHNLGEYGTLQINHVCEKILLSGNNSDIQNTRLKKVIMVNTNDYKKGLFNGDTGVVIDRNEGKAAVFRSQENKIRQYRTSDLPGFDTAFAITVHKSQGSEFGTVLMIIPEKLSPVVTRQLLYTGVTRAKTKVMILGQLNNIKMAMKKNTKRNSGFVSCLENEIQTHEKVS